MAPQWLIGDGRGGITGGGGVTVGSTEGGINGLFPAPKVIFCKVSLSWLKSLGGLSGDMGDGRRAGGGDKRLPALEVPNPD